MKIFKYILINKSDMSDIFHTKDSSEIFCQLYGKKGDYLVIVDEQQIIHITNPSKLTRDEIMRLFP